jgi:hypothetical protein
MSSSFSFSRLGKLIIKQLFENARLYIFSILALSGLLAIIFTFWIFTDGPTYREETTYFIFLNGLLIAGSIFASMSFNMLGSKDKGIYWLSIPATHLEKLICTILFSTVLFTTAYCLCFYLVKSLAISFLEIYLKKNGGTYIEMISLEEGFGKMFKYLIYGYFAVQSLYLLGSVYFSRYSFIVTTVAGALLAFGFAFYISRIDDNMFEGFGWELFSARKMDDSIKDGYLLYSVSPTIASVLKFTVQFAFVPLFWIATWYRLKEKEV